MREILLSLLVVVVAGCPSGDDTSDSSDSSDSSDGMTPDGPPMRVCSLPMTIGDTGALTASKAQQCNVPGTMGARKWYRVAATLPGSMDYVQIELWDGRGLFTGGVVTTGTYAITGMELSPTQCGVCVRGLGDKGTSDQKEYFATSGQVQVTAIGGGGAQVSVTLTNATFGEIDPMTKAPVAMGCSSSVMSSVLNGTIVTVGGGSGGCPTAVGD